MKSPAPIDAPVPRSGLRGKWNRIADALTQATSHALLALAARLAIAGIFFLSGRTKVEGLLTVSDNAYTLFREDYKVPLLPPELAAHLADKNLAVEAKFDEKLERYVLAVNRTQHGVMRHSYIDNDFLQGGDYAQIKKTAQVVQGLLGEGAYVKRGEQVRPDSCADPFEIMVDGVPGSGSRKK